MTPVDPNSPVPAYAQLEQDLRLRIRSGKHRHGSRLPPEQALARLYGVSRVTLRQALQRLAQLDERKSQVVECRFFGGMSVQETAEVLNVSQETVLRDWRLARVWLFRTLGSEGCHAG